MLSKAKLRLATMTLLAATAAPALTQGSAPPPADDPVARAVEAIARIRFASSPTLSPDGRSLAYVSSASGIPQVWVLPLDGSSEPRQLTSLSDPVQSVYWSPVGDWLAYDVAPGGGLNVQIHVMRPDGSASRRLTQGGTENNQLGGWTDDGAACSPAATCATRPESTPSCSIPSPARRQPVATGGLISSPTLAAMDAVQSSTAWSVAATTISTWSTSRPARRPWSRRTSRPGSFSGTLAPDGRTRVCGREFWPRSEGLAMRVRIAAAGDRPGRIACRACGRGAGRHQLDDAGTNAVPWSGTSAVAPSSSWT